MSLLDAGLNIGFLAGAVDDRGVFLVDRDFLGATEHLQGNVLELDAEILGDDTAAGYGGDVLQHGFATVTETRSLDGRNLEAAAQLVDDERGERLALDVFGDNEQRLARLHDRFKQRQQGLETAELLLMDQDVGVFELDHHLFGVGDEVGREIAAIELHALDHVELGLEALDFPRS